MRRALGEEAGQSEVQSRWWRQLDADDSVGLAPLIDYYTTLVGKAGHDFLDAGSREIHHLGLVPDPEFFNDPHEAGRAASTGSEPRTGVDPVRWTP